MVVLYHVSLVRQSVTMLTAQRRSINWRVVVFRLKRVVISYAHKIDKNKHDKIGASVQIPLFKFLRSESVMCTTYQDPKKVAEGILRLAISKLNVYGV